MSSTAVLDRAALEAQAGEDWRRLRLDAGLAGLTLVGLLSAVILAAVGVAGAPLVLVFVVTYLSGGAQAFAEALRDLRRGRLDIDLLMVLAALAAAAVGQPRDGAFLLLLFSLANVLEDFAMGRTKRAVTSLMDLRPDHANRVRGDTLERVPVEQLAVGETVLVRPGEYLPVDGTIVTGASAIDQSAITGESVPVDRGVGDAVFAGTVNRQGALTVRVDKGANATTLARMIALVTEAQSQRSPSQRFSDWFGQRYTLAVLLGSALALAVFLLAGLASGDAFYKTATLLVVASPCAIVISVPAAILSALAGAARRGVLFKGGAALEDFGAVTVMAFDKTGTLTSGVLEVTDVVPLGGEARDLLQLGADLEQQSTHPIAHSVLAAARAAGITPASLEGAQAHPGFGVSAVRDGETVWAGNARFAARFGVDLDAATHSRHRELAAAGKTPVYLGRGSRLEGIIAVADTPRSSARDALESLARRGIARRLMLTGDHREVARAVGTELGLPPEAVRAELLPEEKVAEVEALGRYGKVAFVGDGVNDAAALARADVGIAMGTMGSDAALEAADVALLSDDLRLLADAHGLARRANGIIRQNLVFAIGIMAVMVLLTLFANLPLPLGVIGHEGGTLLVVFNGLRLLLPAGT